MTKIQRYIFFSVLQAVLTIVGGLALLALLAQGLSYQDLIVENRQSALTFLWVILLGAPQVMALLTPIALLVAAVTALNRIHRDSEIVVAQAAGMTRWQIASPILRLAAFAAIAHLCVNLWVQPTAQREMRETISNARSDLAAALIRPGAFTYPADGLTFYARESRGGELKGILISDNRQPDDPTVILAREGNLVTIDGAPALAMQQGQVFSSTLDGEFEDYVYELAPYMSEDSDLYLKASDRYLFELFFPDMKDFYQQRDAERYVAEAHTRLSSPLLNIALAAIAVLTVVGGSYSRMGYQRRMIFGIVGGMFTVIATLSIQSNAVGNPALNVLQYGIPILVTLAVMFVYLVGLRVLPNNRSAAPALKGQPA